MKLMTLNIWGGRVHSSLVQFMAESQTIDIICLQEVFYQAKATIFTDNKPVGLNIFAEIEALLPNHRGFFRPVVTNYGIAMFIKEGIDVVDEGELSIYENPHYCGLGADHPRNLQWAQCRIGKEILTVMNVHALWNGKGKTDTPERIAQSKRIREFMDSVSSPKILCGDFNLRPDTKSLQILTQGMYSLIHMNKITSTRTSFYPKEEKFADYVFTSPDINIHSFEVLPAEVSDHAPLLLDFSLQQVEKKEGIQNESIIMSEETL